MDLCDQKEPLRSKQAELSVQRNFPYNDIDSHFVPPFGRFRTTTR